MLRWLKSLLPVKECLFLAGRACCLIPGLLLMLCRSEDRLDGMMAPLVMLIELIESRGLTGESAELDLSFTHPALPLLGESGFALCA